MRDTVAAISSAMSEAGIGELDRVLGGGVVEGSLMLVGGDPGIGRDGRVCACGRRASCAIRSSGCRRAAGNNQHSSPQYGSSWGKARHAFEPCDDAAHMAIGAFGCQKAKAGVWRAIHEHEGAVR